MSKFRISISTRVLLMVGEPTVLSAGRTAIMGRLSPQSINVTKLWHLLQSTRTLALCRNEKMPPVRPLARSLLILCIFIVFIACSLSAEPRPHGYISLYLDADHSEWCRRRADSGWGLIECWVWCLPSVRGQHGAVFSILERTGAAGGTMTYNEDIVASVSGNLYLGLEVLYQDCQFEWHWLLRQELPHVLAYDPVWKFITDTTTMGPYRFYNCLQGRPSEPCTRLTDLYLNYDPCPGIAAETSSWGAIKSLFRR